MDCLWTMFFSLHTYHLSQADIYRLLFKTTFQVVKSLVNAEYAKILNHDPLPYGQRCIQLCAFFFFHLSVQRKLNWMLGQNISTANIYSFFVLSIRYCVFGIYLVDHFRSLIFYSVKGYFIRSLSIWMTQPEILWALETCPLMLLLLFLLIIISRNPSVSDFCFLLLA